MMKLHNTNGKTFVAIQKNCFNASKKRKTTSNVNVISKIIFPPNQEIHEIQRNKNIHKTVENPSSLPLVSPSYYPNYILYNNIYRVKSLSRKSFAFYSKGIMKCEHISYKQLSEQKKTSGKKENPKSKKDESKKSKIINDTKLSRNLAKRKKKLDAEEKKKRANRKNNSIAINYSKLDSKGDPSISFEVRSKRRDELLAILNVKIKGKGAKKEDKIVRNRTIKKLGKEFGRIYKRYRNMLLDSRGCITRFMMPPDSDKYCQKAALQCIYNGITPRQLLEYWDNHINDFANGSFTKPYPPLSFLSSNFASEQVAMALFEETNGGTKKWSVGDFSKNSKGNKKDTHSFFDTEQLDRRLRPGLLDAGFELGDKYDNRYLMTVQKTAMAIANGKKIFVSGKLKEMTDWAVDNLYGDVDE